MIDKFIDYLRYERNRSELTVESYGRSLRDFETYFKNRDSQLSWESVDSDIIRDWMESMMDKGDMASTVNRCLSAVRSFYRFALSRGLVKHDPSHIVKGPKKQKMLPQYVRENEMDRLLDIPEMWGDAYKDIRARTIIILLYETGLRRSELTGLNDADVDFVSRQLKVTGKRNKQRVIPFGDEMAAELQRYILARNAQFENRTEDALFLSDKGRRVTPSQVYVTVRKYLSKVTTMKKRSPHVLRHSFATAMLNNGAGIESVRKLLGHESVATTEIYTHTTFEQLKKVYKNAHPRA
ncbi:MAG: tyrosine-type recombinase/integrase [Eggerthellaceae bacterium]|nr:tyrosine-type recombinase/integrase [Eggerthellaceae bacterium]